MSHNLCICYYNVLQWCWWCEDFTLLLLWNTPAEVLFFVLRVWPEHLPPNDHPPFLYRGEHNVVAILAGGACGDFSSFIQCYELNLHPWLIQDVTFRSLLGPFWHKHLCPGRTTSKHPWCCLGSLTHRLPLALLQCLQKKIGDQDAAHMPGLLNCSQHCCWIPPTPCACMSSFCLLFFLPNLGHLVFCVSIVVSGQ